MTGLLGGTFDPPHYGHLILADEAMSRFDLEKVVFVPARVPPHKNGGMSPFEHRMAMTVLAVEADPRFEVRDMETPGEPSYTWRLLRTAREKLGGVLFLMGMDSLCELTTWMRYPELLDEAAFAAATRPGWSSVEVDPELLARVEVFEIPGVDISSSELRRRFARGRGARYLTPGSVCDYAIREGLYV
jgi:nicotinate-nucleotide adenylyltransferase